MNNICFYEAFESCTEEGAASEFSERKFLENPETIIEAVPEEILERICREGCGTVKILVYWL